MSVSRLLTAYQHS